ncbi:LigA [Xanthobacter versatilis]|uniref:LigA n=1 Tax=Xanthobacter autotrophicus (strain ATCC BAA-1158 / Py2) TaxID=78245 RepID=A7ILT6_XANP2|nr:LigA [Xanthobacter autotrophicus Py2]
MRCAGQVAPPPPSRKRRRAVREITDDAGEACAAGVGAGSRLRPYDAALPPRPQAHGRRQRGGGGGPLSTIVGPPRRGRHPGDPIADLAAAAPAPRRRSARLGHPLRQPRACRPARSCQRADGTKGLARHPGRGAARPDGVRLRPPRRSRRAGPLRHHAGRHRLLPAAGGPRADAGAARDRPAGPPGRRSSGQRQQRACGRRHGTAAAHRRPVCGGRRVRAHLPAHRPLCGPPGAPGRGADSRRAVHPDAARRARHLRLSSRPGGEPPGCDGGPARPGAGAGDPYSRRRRRPDRALAHRRRPCPRQAGADGGCAVAQPPGAAPGQCRHRHRGAAGRRAAGDAQRPRRALPERRVPRCRRPQPQCAAVRSPGAGGGGNHPRHACGRGGPAHGRGSGAHAPGDAGRRSPRRAHPALSRIAVNGCERTCWQVFSRALAAPRGHWSGRGRWRRSAGFGRCPLSRPGRRAGGRSHRCRRRCRRDCPAAAAAPPPAPPRNSHPDRRRRNCNYRAGTAPAARGE